MQTIATTIESTLRGFKIDAHVEQVIEGPSVTTYGLAVPAGVRVSKVEGVLPNIALALGHESLRLVSPLPGTGLLGIEVPNEVRADVTLASVPVSGAQRLDIPVGVDTFGQPVVADLARLPHLLVAGSTGSGKSVALTSILTSLIANTSPFDVRLTLVDPKRVEMRAFANAPHVESVITDMNEAEAALAWMVDLMDYRYTRLEAAGAKSIDAYNATAARTWAHHVVVIDEMADLMQQRRAAVEPLIVRLAQLARAAGIHLVLATQRPTVDVVTGLIKANVPSRWAFTVASGRDSQVVLDEAGAENLTGRGDSLFVATGQRTVRVQAPFVSDAEVAHTVAAARATWGGVRPARSPETANLRPVRVVQQPAVQAPAAPVVADLPPIVVTPRPASTKVMDAAVPIVLGLAVKRLLKI